MTARDGKGITATQEIKSEDWSAFFQLFSQMERDTLVNIEHTDKTGANKIIAAHAPLSKLEFDRQGACSNVLRISTGGGGAFEITEPIQVKIRHDANSRKILQIDAESGSTTIGFHSGRLEEALRALEQSAAAK